MARSRRQTRWVDAVESTSVAVAGAAAPGTINNRVLTTEQELEQEGLLGSTLIRIVGDLWCDANAGRPIVTFAWWWSPAYVGAVDPTDWDNDTFDRRDDFYIWMCAPRVNVRGERLRVDIRAKRKVSPGMVLQCSVQNHSVGGNDASFVWHQRMLYLLA